jgi:hypothetical protein
LGNVFFGKGSVKPTEEKPVEKPSEEKRNEQPHPKLKPMPMRFHCDYYGRDGHKGEFCFKRKREERMAEKWANKDRHNPSHGVPEPRMPLLRSKEVLTSVLAWGDASSYNRGGFMERAVRQA